MNDNFAKKQLKLLHLLEDKYELDSSIVSQIYLPLFFKEKDADGILKEIEIFEKTSDSLKIIRSKVQDLLNDRYLEVLSKI